MIINLVNRNTTFGATYTSPPEHFTTGEAFQAESPPKHKFIATFSVPEKKAYFVTLVNGSVVVRDGWGFGRLIENASSLLTGLNPNIRFVPGEIFDNCERIPFEMLSQRNIAVLASDTEYCTLGDVSAENRRQSFYHNKAPVHPQFWDERIDEFVKLGFFYKPADLTPLVPSADDTVINISFDPQGLRKPGLGRWKEHCNIEAQFKQFSFNYPNLFDYAATCHLLASPVIEISKSPQPAVISSIYSPRNGYCLMLIRHPDTKLSMLQGSEAIEAKHQAFIDYATVFPQSINRKEFSKSIQEADFFKKPYSKAIQFCETAINELTSLIPEKKSNNGSPLIKKTIEILFFAKNYMDNLSVLIKKVMIYDDLLMLKNNTPAGSELIKDQKKNNEQLMAKEIDFIFKAKEQKLLTDRCTYIPLLYMHSFIMTSLSELLMNDMIHYMEDYSLIKIYELNEQAKNILFQIDELFSKKETILSLRLKSISLD